MSLHLCLSVCVSVSLRLCSSVCLSVSCLSLSVSVYLSLCVSVCVSVCLFVSLSNIYTFTVQHVGGKAGELEPPARGVSARGGGQTLSTWPCSSSKGLRERVNVCLFSLALADLAVSTLYSPSLRVLGGDAVPLLRPPAGGSHPRPLSPSS